MTYELEEIKEIRRRMGLTQTELAKKSGVSQSLIAKIERGKIDPTYTKTKRIFDVLSNLTKERELKAEDVMNKKIISVKPGDLVKDVVKKMRKYEISQLPVIGKHVRGIISEGLILENMDKVNVKVEEIMGECPPIIPKKCSMEIVSNLLRYCPILLVIDNGNLVGVVTKSDIIRKLEVHRS